MMRGRIHEDRQPIEGHLTASTAIDNQEAYPAALENECRRLKGERAALRRQNEYLSALHETSLGLIDKLDKKELLEAILERAALLTGTGHGYIYLLEHGEKEMQMRVGMGFFKSQLGRRVKLGEGMGGKVWESEEPVVVDEYHSWPGRLADSDLDRLQSIVGIPLKSYHGVLGVIGLARVEAGKPFAAEDVRILSRFAELALIALEKARLYADVRRELAERKRAEAILRESEKRYRVLLDSSPDPIVVYDMEGEATYVNPAFEQTFGWSREKLLGKQINFVPDENWPETQAAIKSMLGGEKIIEFETRRLTSDGRVLDVCLSSTLYMDWSGKPAGNIVTLRDISARKSAERELGRHHDHLEELVAARTVQLAKINAQLQQEIEERKRAEKELEAQSLHLEEVNTALKVLLKQRDMDRVELGENVLSNVKELVEPYLGGLRKSQLSTHQGTLVGILETNLNNIISPFISKLSNRFFNLTPTEVRVANLVKDGKTNKEIAALLFLSKNTILFHRQNIRAKLGLKNQKVNLRTHLLSFEE